MPIQYSHHCNIPSVLLIYIHSEYRNLCIDQNNARLLQSCHYNVTTMLRIVGIHKKLCNNNVVELLQSC